MSILTIDEVREMTKGDELDQAVANIVMEWPNYVANTIDDDTTFHPSRVLSSAWEVVKKMQSINLCLSLKSKKSWDSIDWLATFNSCAGISYYYLTAIDKDVEVAICKAALMMKLRKNEPKNFA